VTGTPGQPDAGRLAGGAFVLQGGFHRRAVAVPAGDVVFAAGFE
jgi:predicted 2-oxoglutarate/Fe(II)-dependent dioxygenase YbiX